MGDQRVMPERQLPKGSYLRRAASAAGALPCTDAPPEPHGAHRHGAARVS